MKRLLNIAFSVLLWAAIVAYLVWAGTATSRRLRDIPAAGVDVVVTDSAQMRVITPGMVRAWIDAAQFIPPNISAREVPTDRIARMVRSRGFVKQARVYVDFHGTTHVELSQRRPMMRLMTLTGYNVYITDDGWVLPAQPHEAIWLPIVTGNYTPPFERGYVGPIRWDEKNHTQKEEFLHKLISFVQFIENDDFWSACIEQINVVDRSGSGITVYDPCVEFVPRAGNHLVVLGSLDGYPGKLDKLMSFYQRALSYEGWDSYKTINLEYKGQVVCTK